ncbi:hypothetical protein CICLE_v10027529mg [Citrus x clementina]|uniref:Uncharacterized protein n=1 Tax=Citrus clementina TaxID=85681 RepID=V4SPP6_CITCL|nr:hypothetical protein CICLE_v10027529mg [Citrus x clementina]
MPKFWNKFVKNLELRVKDKWIKNDVLKSKPISLFVLFFGALLGQDSITIAKLAAVFISMDGVAMTTVGKTWAVDEFLSASEEDKYVVNKLC